MKPCHRNRFVPCFAIVLSLTGHSPAAVERYWNVGGTGGDGNWGTSPGDKNWNTVAGAAAGNTAWPEAGDVAVFQDEVGGTVTLFGDVQAAGIRQTGADHTINAGTITLVRDSSLNTPSIHVAAGTLSIDSVLAGNHGLNQSGAGNLVLSGANTYTGITSLSDGVITLTGSLASATLDIGGAATFVDQAGGLDVSAVLTNSSRFIVNSAETVAGYTQSGSGSVLAGSDALTTIHGAILAGGTVSGSLLGDITVAGSVGVSGMLGGGSLMVETGVLEMTGLSHNTPVTIASTGTLIDVSGGLDAAAVVANAGIFSVNASETVSSYTQNGNGSLAGSGVLSVTHGATLNGGSVSGKLMADIDSRGEVGISGIVAGGTLAVTAGTLTLSGSSTHSTVNISTAGSLVDSSSGLAAAALVTNSGSLALGTNDTIAAYVSHGGLLAAGSGTLVTATTLLNHGSSVAGRLWAETLTTQGEVGLSGTADGNHIRIAGGILNNSGHLGNLSAQLDIAAGATLVAGGTQRYGLLTTSGAGAATWQGNLVNPAVVAPGGLGETGALRVTGNFTNSPGGTLKLDLAPSTHDRLDVVGSVVFGGTLDLNQVGAVPIAPFVPVPLISASRYAGTFSSLLENIDGAVVFNPLNGTVTRIGSSTGDGFLTAVTANRRSTWISLYDDAIDPGTVNISRIPGSPGGLAITSGIADATNPDLAWALAASLNPAGLNTALLDRLSPEGYAGFGDYAAQATRVHQRTALSAPPLTRSAAGTADSTDSKASAKAAIRPAEADLDWIYFAAIDSFNVDYDSSRSRSNHSLSGIGFIAGSRVQVRESVQLAAYLAVDGGSIGGNGIDGDGLGGSVGAVAGFLLDGKSLTRLTTAVSYGSYRFDGSRGSVAATEAGASFGRVDFDDVDSDSLELFAGIETTVYRNRWIRIIPTAGIRYATGSTDGFTESTPAAPGSPIALEVAANHEDSLLLEMGVSAESDLTDRLMVQAQLGFNAGLLEDSQVIKATFVKGSRPMHAKADGLDDDLVFIGLGANYRVNEAVGIGIGYRVEFRSDSGAQQGLSLSSTFRF